MIRIPRAYGPRDFFYMAAINSKNLIKLIQINGQKQHNITTFAIINIMKSILTKSYFNH